MEKNTRDLIRDQSKRTLLFSQKIIKACIKKDLKKSIKKVKGRCVNTKAARFFAKLTPSAPPLYKEEPKAFIASSLLDMPPS